MKPSSKTSAWLAAMLLSCAMTGPASAQRPPALGGGLPSLPLPGLNNLTGDLAATVRDELPADRMLDLAEEARKAGLRDLVRANPRALEFDSHGEAVVRAEVMAFDPGPSALEAAVKAGFIVARETQLDPLDIRVVVLTPPADMSARDALRRLRRLDPTGRYDLDHIYSPSGESLGETGAVGGGGDTGRGSVGLLDTGVAADHPALSGSLIAQRSFAPGGVQVGAHGTAVASLMAGSGPGYRGADPGARLWVADVYGSGPTGGSADAIIHALAWMAQQRAPVINISLVGPANIGVEAAVKAVIARGELVVAPVGNDGPAAEPLFPASYPGVIAVTAVDRKGRLLLEAGRASHIDFAAPGADILAAKPGGGFAAVRGTSFAAPIVSGRLARLLDQPDPILARKAVAELAKTARRSNGSDLQHGIIGEDLANGLRTGGK